MATGRWVRMTLYGEKFTGDFAGEEFQTGIGMVDTDGGGVFAGAIREDLPTFNVVVTGNAEANATWDIEWAWHGSEKFTKLNQIGIADQALTFWNAIKANVPTDLRLTEVRIAAWDSNRKVINGANVFALKTPVAGAAAAASQLPPQIALVASLRTGARGPRGRGRMYLPMNGTAGSGGKVGTTQRNLAGNSVASLVSGVRGIGPRPVIVNQTPLTYSDITQIQVGDLWDTQRRRRNQVQEAYNYYTP